jgi:hypothetical protein
VCNLGFKFRVFRHDAEALPKFPQKTLIVETLLSRVQDCLLGVRVFFARLRDQGNSPSWDFDAREALCKCAVIFVAKSPNPI